MHIITAKFFLNIFTIRIFLDFILSKKKVLLENRKSKKKKKKKLTSLHFTCINTLTRADVNTLLTYRTWFGITRWLNTFDEWTDCKLQEVK